MSEPIHIVFCADRRVLPGLHVAAYSVVASHNGSDSLVHIHVFSNDLTPADVALLKETLRGTGRNFSLEMHSISASHFSKFPSMTGSWGAYFRLLVPQMLLAERFAYVDVDTVCHLDVGDFMTLDIGDCPAGFVAETTIQATPDRSLAERLPNDGDKPYLNSGVMVVNRKRWLERRVTEDCLKFLQEVPVLYHDQTALNYILLNGWRRLDNRFNYISNWRQNWPALCDATGVKGKLIHFLDIPKPWDFLGEFVHPQYRLWREVLDQTSLKDFRSWHATPTRKLPKTRLAWSGYKRALKDRVLFAGYARGWLKNVKGIPSRPPVGN
jgi:lipopolysaccharide biosynthesis glycosyltransferase